MKYTFNNPYCSIIPGADTPAKHEVHRNRMPQGAACPLQADFYPHGIRKW